LRLNGLDRFESIQTGVLCCAAHVPVAAPPAPISRPTGQRHRLPCLAPIARPPAPGRCRSPTACFHRPDPTSLLPPRGVASDPFSLHCLPHAATAPFKDCRRCHATKLFPTPSPSNTRAHKGPSLIAMTTVHSGPREAVSTVKIRAVVVSLSLWTAPHLLFVPRCSKASTSLLPTTGAPPPSWNATARCHLRRPSDAGTLW
jgi:hypothetical protein